MIEALPLQNILFLYILPQLMQAEKYFIYILKNIYIYIFLIYHFQSFISTY